MNLKEFQTIKHNFLFLIFGIGVAVGQQNWYPNLYPWNVTLAAYHTTGQYSSGGSYKSDAFYYSMDKRLKDRFTISIENIIITDSLVNYRQTNYFGRDNFFISSGFRLGGIIGRFHAGKTMITDTTFAVTYPDMGTLHRQVQLIPSGWVTGLQAMGDVYKFGYSLLFIHSLYQNVYEYKDEYQYNTASDTSLVYKYEEDEKFNQIALTLSKQLGKHIFRGGWITQTFPQATYQSASIVWEWAVTKTLYSTIYFQKGKARFMVDPVILLLDNNPDILRNIFNLRAAWRFNPHWTVTGVFSTNSYHSGGMADTYHINYWALGLQLRF